MTDAEALIKQHLAVLVGLEVSGVNHAADMLTLQFGPLRQVTTRRGTVKQVGAWALHVQCNWLLERDGRIFASQAGFRGSDNEINRAVKQLQELLTAANQAVVEGVEGNATGNVRLALAGGLDLIITPDSAADDEDWRLFAPGMGEKHFVIGGGKIVDPDSLG